MHTEICPSIKLSCELDTSTPNNISVLEDDLALSSSTLGNYQDYQISLARSSLLQFTGQQYTSCQTEHSANSFRPSNNLIYVNEDTMDCSYAESSGTPKNRNSKMEVSSPEMFESDDDVDDEDENKSRKDFTECLPRPRDKLSSANSSILEKSVEPTTEELLAKSDCHLLARMNKFLTGVPPPPKHTICQSDCADLLARILENREYFLVDPLNDEKKKTRLEEKESRLYEKVTSRITTEIGQSSIYERSFKNHRGKSSLRNLTNAFDACLRNDSTTTSLDGEPTTEYCPENSNDCRTSGESTNNEDIIDKFRNNDATEEETLGNLVEPTVNTATSAISGNRDKIKHVSFKMPQEEPGRFYCTTLVENVINLPWEFAYGHKTHGIHYNRSKIVEEFENLTTKLCQRYVGAETQSSCNIWFTKQTPGSVKKRSLLSRRNNGQSPGKRLSHLARRRRTFSSANLQGLGMTDKKQLVLNIKKPTIRRGKSPRGSAKKRAALSRVSPSPRKSKLETSKRALFQSPPGERAGPSNKLTTLTATNPQQRIRRALFSSTKKDDVPNLTSNVLEIKRISSFDESRKRKSEDDLEGAKVKRTKSFSVDSAQGIVNHSADLWTSEKRNIPIFPAKNENSHQGKCELSDTHRKKLFWAVAEALRAKGIGIGHPRFKHCASQLAQTVKKHMPDLENRNVPRKPGSTSDRMLRLAKLHIHLIVETKTTE